MYLRFQNKALWESLHLRNGLEDWDMAEELKLTITTADLLQGTGLRGTDSQLQSAGENGKIQKSVCSSLDVNKTPISPTFKCDQIESAVSAGAYAGRVQLLTPVSGCPFLPAPEEVPCQRRQPGRADPSAHGCLLPGTLPDARGKAGSWRYLWRLVVVQGMDQERGSSLASRTSASRLEFF